MVGYIERQLRMMQSVMEDRGPAAYLAEVSHEKFCPMHPDSSGAGHFCACRPDITIRDVDGNVLAFEAG